MFQQHRVVVVILVAVRLASSAHTTSTSPISSSCSNTSSTCPPFTPPLSFPFSSTLGCGHPHFQIRCSSTHSTISINNLSFTVLAHKPNTNSLHLSFSSCLSNLSINLSSSPFRFSQTCCNTLSALKLCSPLQIPNCSLFKTPLRLLQGCQQHSTNNIDHQAVCNNHHFLTLEVEWDLKNDTYLSKCTVCQAQNGVCGFNSSDPRKQFLCYAQPFSSSSSSWFSGRPVLISILFISTCLLLLLLVLLTFIYRWFRLIRSPTHIEDGEEEDPSILFLHRHCSANLVPLPPVFTFEELESSTNRFDPRRKIGDGGFGSVYLGQLYDGRIVAVKKLHHRPEIISRAASTKSFCNEILILSSIHHPNLVKLHGFCSDPRGLVLVYDYVSNGTLADHLHGSNTFYTKQPSFRSWQVRVEVALQTAMALEYLHFFVEPAIVHRDITSSNIFVEKDMRIKVGDFGLSRLLVLPDPCSTSTSCGGYICTGPQGTPGYLDPDYHRSFRLTQKSDVYSFGVVLFELLTGMKAVDLTRDKREVALADLVVSKIQMGSLHQVVDPVLITQGDSIATVEAVAELAFRCVAADKDDRPDAKEVVVELKRIRDGLC